MIHIGIFGATGYTGVELIRILERHPNVEISFATSQSYVGKKMSDVFPVRWNMPLINVDETQSYPVEAAFICLPAGAATEAAVLANSRGSKVIDLSADFRLKEAEVYQQWYKITHSAPTLLSEAVYGLPEVYREEITQASLVANPGCYPTSILLALYPLLKDGQVSGGPIVADSKSGVSGAGRSLSLKSHYVEVNENLVPYNLGRAHRHYPEMEQEIERMGGERGKLFFSPHLVPVTRGILSTLYVPVCDTLKLADLRQLFEQTYAGEPFVWVLPEGEIATLAHSVYSNRCTISVSLPAPGQAIICSSIDNLVKGAAGQAVQNFNLMFGLDEGTGLIA